MVAVFGWVRLSSSRIRPIVFRGLRKNRLVSLRTPKIANKAAINRLRLRTAAINKLCTFILDRPRRQARRNPCHCFASAKIPSITGARRRYKARKLSVRLSVRKRSSAP